MATSSDADGNGQRARSSDRSRVSWSADSAACVCCWAMSTSTRPVRRTTASYTSREVMTMGPSAPGSTPTPQTGAAA